MLNPYLRSWKFLIYTIYIDSNEEGYVFVQDKLSS